MLGIEPVFGSFAIIVAVALLQCAEGRYNTFRVILAGENTPVWTARCNHFTGCKDKPVQYMRLNKDTIRKTLQYWKSDRFKPLSFGTGKYPRSIKESDYADYEDESYDFYGPKKMENKFESSQGNVTRTKRYNILDKVQYGLVVASVLVMVNYDASTVKDKASRRRFVKEKILHTLAYWNSFNRKVYEIKGIQYKTHVQVQLVGIIIGLVSSFTFLKNVYENIINVLRKRLGWTYKDRDATPYISTSYTPVNCLIKADKYWERSPNESEFPRDSYHVVATMTDVVPSGPYGGFETIPDKSSPSMLVWDNLNFWNLFHKHPIAYQEPGNFLRNMAYEFPKVYDHMKPGKRIETILPGMLASPEQQCKIKRRNFPGRTCPKHSTDCSLYCEDGGFFNICMEAGTVLDGTPCTNGVVG